MAYEFNVFAGLLEPGTDTLLIFAGVGQNAGLEVHIVGTSLAYDGVNHVLSGNISEITLYDPVAGDFVQRTEIDAADQATIAAAVTTFVDHADQIIDDTFGAWDLVGNGFASFGAINLISDTEATIEIRDSAEVTIGYLKLTGAGFNTALGLDGPSSLATISSITHLDASQVPVPGDTPASYDPPMSLAELSYGLLKVDPALGNSEEIYAVFLQGANNITANDTSSNPAAGQFDILPGGSDTFFTSSNGFIHGNNATSALTIDFVNGSASATGISAVFAPGTVTGAEGSVFGDTITGDDGDDYLRGDAGNDTISGGTGGDLLVGGAGDDVLTSGPSFHFNGALTAVDVMIGDAGNDTFDGTDNSRDLLLVSYREETATGGIIVNLDSISHTVGPQTVTAGHAIDRSGGTDTLINIFNVMGTDAGDVFFGGAADESFTPGSGNDTIHGGGNTAGGEDLLWYGFVSVIGTAGGQPLNDAFGYTTGINVAYTGTGAGTVSGQTSGPGIVDSGTDIFDGIENIIGSRFDDVFTAAATGTNKFAGMAGNDTFTGSVGGIETVDYSYDNLSGATSGVAVNLSGSSVVIPGGPTVAAGTAFDSLGGLDVFVSIDNVVGSQFADFIVGNDGANVLDGGQGGDFISGNDGDDTLKSSVSQFSSTGFAFLVGGDGGDTFDASGATNGASVMAIVSYGDETGSLGVRVNLDTTSHTTTIGTALSLAAGKGLDTFGNTDTFIGITDVGGTTHQDEIFGSSASESFNTGGGNDRIHGGGGSDALSYVFVTQRNSDFWGFTNAGLNITFTSVAGGTVSGTAASGAFVTTFDSIETIYGSQFNDVFNGFATGSNRFSGMGGNDTFNGKVGAFDTVTFDSNFVSGGNTGVNINLLTGTGTDGLGGTDTYVSIEQIFATEFSDTLTGGGGAESLDGVMGDDTIKGGGGNDTLIGGGGNDDLAGDAGNDLLDALSFDSFFTTDTLTGGAGNDTYVIGTDTAVITETDANVVTGGRDLVRTTVSLTSALAANVEDVLLLAGAINAFGNGLGNVMTGNAVGNALDGDAGNDLLNGAGGVDTLTGGAGNDTFVLGADADVVNDASGIDTITSSLTRSLTGFATIENLTLLTGAVNGTGNGLGNVIIGNTALNRLDGAGGNDRLDGGADALADVLIGGIGNDTYIIRSATDNITDTVGQGTADRAQIAVSFTLATGDNVEFLETILATATTALNLTGNEIAQTITGNNGSNIINGKGGNDTLRGNSGNDFFVFNTALNASTNKDSITDYNVAADTIRLENTGAGLFNALGNGALAAAAFNKGAGFVSAKDATDRIIYNTSTGDLYYDRDGLGGAAAIKFATITTKVGLTAADFFVI